MKLKKLVAFIIAATIVISITPFAFSEVESSVLSEVLEYQIDISEYFNADFIAYEGDELDSKTWMGGEEFASNVFSKTGYPKASYYSEDTTVSGVTYPAGSLENYWPASNAFHSFSSAFADGEKMSEAVYNRYGINYNFNTEAFSGSVKDAVLFDVTGTSVTIETSKRPSSEISFAYIQPDGTREIPISLKYTDGAIEQKIVKFTHGNNSGVLVTPYTAIERNNNPESENYGKAQNVNTYVRGSLKEDIEAGTAEVATWYGVTIDMKSVSVEVNKEKILESITFDYSEDSSVCIAIFAATEKAVSNSELQKIVDNLTTSSLDGEAKKAKIAIEELILRGASEEEYAEKLALANRLIFSDNPTIIYTDLEKYIKDSKLGADMIGKIGDSAGNNWLGGFEGNSRFTGLNADYINHTDGIITSTEIKNYGKCEIIYDEGGNISGFKNFDGTTASEYPAPEITGETITVKLYEDGFSGGVNDAVDLKSGVTIELSGRPLDKVWFAFATSSSPFDYNLEVEYTDGTTGTLSINPLSCFFYSNLIYMGTNFVPSYIENENMTQYKIENEGSISVNEETKKIEKASYNGDHIGYTMIGKEIGNKGIKSITFPKKDNILLAAITEIPSNTETLISFVEKVVGYSYINDDNAADINLAKNYTEELIRRGIYSDNSFEVLKIKTLCNQSEIEKPDYVDLSKNKHFTADMVGFEGDVVDESWLGGIDKNHVFSGLDATYIFPDVEKTDLEATDGIIISDNVIDFTGCKVIYDDEGNIAGYENADGTTVGADGTPKGVTTSQNASFKLYNKGLKGGISDAIDLDEGATVELNGRPLKEIWFAFNVNGRLDQYNLEVEYTDGSTAVLSIYPMSMHILKNDIATAAERLGNEKMAAFQFERFGGLEPDRNNRLIVNDYGIEGTSKVERIGYTMIGKKIDNKGIKSITFPKTNSALLAGITQIPSGLEILVNYINKVKEYPFVQEENISDIKLAKTYIDELKKWGVYTDESSDFKKINALYNQIDMDDIYYVDLSSDADVDVFVPINTAFAEGYVRRNSELYNSNNITSDIITMDSPSGETLPGTVREQYPHILTGQTFKLSGGYNGIGNDAVSVKKDGNDAVITLPDAKQRRYRDVKFLFNANLASQSPSEIDVIITYKDGSVTEAKSYIFNPTLYYKGFFASKAIGCALKEDEDGDMFVKSRDVEMNLFASELNPVIIKNTDGDNVTYTHEDVNLLSEDVVSVAFKPASYDYDVLAVTFTPYTTKELYNEYENFKNKNYDVGSINASMSEQELSAIKNGALSGIELYEVRKVDAITYESYIYCTEILEAVNKLHQNTDTDFTVIPSVSSDGKTVTATATVVNNTEYAKDAFLIVAVYGENDKLLNINMTEVQSFKNDGNQQSLSINCDDHKDAVKYKAFVWQSFDVLRGIAVAETPAN